MDGVASEVSKAMTYEKADELGRTPSGAIFSDDGMYRYALWRVWDCTLPLLGYGLLNPSTADAATNDPTISRCCTRAKLLGYGGIIVWNLFAFRATDPKDMKRAAEPIGELNPIWIMRCVRRCAMTICGWGTDGAYKQQGRLVRHFLRHHCLPYYLRLSEKTGQPWHPLYLPYDLKPQPWGELE